MKELNQLEQELKAMLDNIQRVKKFVKEHKDEKHKPYNANVWGELKHRGIAIKSTITRVNHLSTWDLFRKL